MFFLLQIFVEISTYLTHYVSLAGSALTQFLQCKMYTALKHKNLTKNHAAQVHVIIQPDSPVYHMVYVPTPRRRFHLKYFHKYSVKFVIVPQKRCMYKPVYANTNIKKSYGINVEKPKKEKKISSYYQTKIRCLTILALKCEHCWNKDLR